MKILEITDKNSAWANVSNIDFASIRATFIMIKEAWPVIVNSRSTTLIQVHKQNLINYVGLITEIMDKLDRFPDTADSDLASIKLELSSIKNYASKLIQ